MVRINGVVSVRCEPGWSLAPAWSAMLADQDLWYVRAGRGRMRLRGGRVVGLTPGVAVWARPGGEYLAEQEPEDRLAVTAIHFDTPHRAPSEEVYHFQDAAFGSAVLGHVVTLWRQTHRDAAERLLAVVLDELKTGVCSRSSDLSGTELHRAQAIDAAVAAIREAPSEANDVGDLARRAGYSPSHFSRLFHERVGVSPRDFIVQCRTERARQLLLNTPLTVGQIADVLGYSSVYFFSRQFKRSVGISPAAYRQQAR